MRDSVPRPASAAAATSMARSSQGLQERGYVEGQNRRDRMAFLGPAATKVCRIVGQMIGLARRRCLSCEAAYPSNDRETKATKAKIPLVFVGCQRPVGGGLVSSLARPGGNTTGLATLTRGITRESAELVKELCRRLPRVSFSTIRPILQLRFPAKRFSDASRSLIWLVNRFPRGPRPPRRLEDCAK